MSRSYRLTPEAQANVDEICAFIAEDTVDAAMTFAMVSLVASWPRCWVSRNVADAGDRHARVVPQWSS